jgi:hypothetical protein
MLQFLLDHGAPPDQHWEEAVAEAARRGHMEAVRFLMSISPPVPPAEELKQQWLEQEQLEAEAAWSFDRLPVFVATAAGQVEALELLLQDGRWSSRALLSHALYNAAFRGRLSAIKLLVRYGADANDEYSDGVALRCALRCTQLAAAELLLRLGAEPGDLALEAAVKSGRPVTACRLVLQYGAKDTAQNTALYLAAQQHKQGAVQVLLAANQRFISHTEKTSRLEAALTGAASGGNIQLVQELLTSLDHHLAGGGKESADARVRALTKALQAVEGEEQGQRERRMESFLCRLRHQRTTFGMDESEGTELPSALPTAEWDRVAEVLRPSTEQRGSRSRCREMQLPGSLLQRSWL